MVRGVDVDHFTKHKYSNNPWVVWIFTQRIIVIVILVLDVDNMFFKRYEAGQ